VNWFHEARRPEGRRAILVPDVIRVALLVIGIGCLAYYGFSLVEAGLYDLVQGYRLDSLLQDPSAWGAKGRIAAATRSTVKTSGLVGRIEIPRIGLSAIVAEGIEESTLRKAVGHLPETPFPGEPGNVALAGHRETHFRKLGDVRSRDRIQLKTPDGIFQYRVESAVVAKPTETDKLRPGSVPSITLITCYPFNFIGRAPERFVVRAVQVYPGMTPAP